MLWKYKKCYQETNKDVVNPVPTLYMSQISSTSQIDPTDSCNLLTLNTDVYITQQNAGFLTVGDMVYTDNLATNPFVGDSNFYKIKSINSATYTAQVDNAGVVLSSPGFGICL